MTWMPLPQCEICARSLTAVSTISRACALTTAPSYRVSGTLALRQGAAVAASLRVSYDHVALPQGTFDATVAGLRAAYSFTPRIYIQSLIQFNNRTNSWLGNLRFGWLSTAGTWLFVVYNEGRGTGDLAGPLERTLMVKLTRQIGFELSDREERTHVTAENAELVECRAECSSPPRAR